MYHFFYVKYTLIFTFTFPSSSCSHKIEDRLNSYYYESHYEPRDWKYTLKHHNFYEMKNKSINLVSRDTATIIHYVYVQRNIKRRVYIKKEGFCIITFTRKFIVLKKIEISNFTTCRNSESHVTAYVIIKLKMWSCELKYVGLPSI